MMQCANTVLGLGARPIMAEHPLEVKEITATADALLLNLGNISDSRMEAMEIALEEAKRNYEALKTICEQLVRETGSIEDRHDLAVSCERLGVVEQNLGHLEEARRNYEADLDGHVLKAHYPTYKHPHKQLKQNRKYKCSLNSFL